MNIIDILVRQLMLPILTFFFQITHSYGWSIMLLTLVVKGALLPLTAQQFKSAKTMQRLQPQLQELQTKYKDKPEELQKALMEFYKEHQYNPFTGCLPILIQMPFLIALYATLISPDFSKTIAGQAFFFIEDLARKGMWSAGVPHWDNLLMLVVFGVSTFISQKMMTTNPDDPTQKQMLVTMPLMITVMFAWFPVPAGVLLYLVFSNIITLGQNYALLKWSPALHGEPVKPQEPPQQNKKGK